MLKALDEEKLLRVERETPACLKFSVYDFIPLATFGYRVGCGGTWLMPAMEALGVWAPASWSQCQ